MRAITKLPEPRSLAQFRAGVDVTAEGAYDDFPHKDDVREQLVAEQRGLCAFCGCRIVNDPLKMKIAHWKPRKLRITDAEGREIYPNLPDQLAYWNMLGCCQGNPGPPETTHCDTHQENLPLSRNPADPTHRIEDSIAFLADGSIASSDPQLNAELGCKRADGVFDEGVLNLNLARLRANRKGALDAFRNYLDKKGHPAKDKATRMLAEWRGDASGMLRPYAPVIAYWLKKHLARNS